MEDSKVVDFSQVLAELAEHNREWGDHELESTLETIEDHIRTSTTRAKEQLGAALLTIGRRNDRFQQLALEVAQKLGRIEIDHPELGKIEGHAVDVLKDPELAKRLIEAMESKESKDPPELGADANSGLSKATPPD